MLRTINIMFIMVMLLPVIAPARHTINNGATTGAEAKRMVVVEPSIRSKSSFAIVTDSVTFSKLSGTLKAYKEVVEMDNLATCIVAADWSSPDEVKSLLIELSQSQMPIEGAVFVGDIPIVLSRDAQHLASAFTARQSEVVTESTIATDRFYDDFDLKWEFICRDTNNKNLFYYSLRFDSPQTVKTDIYSARIRATGEERYSKIDKFLKKVVAAHKEKNRLDNLFMFRGTSYNSETYDGWSGEQIVLREQFPQLFVPGSTTRFVDFNTYYPVKPYILEYLRMPGLDVVLGHHHGSYTRQYLNDDSKAYTVSQAIDLAARDARAQYWRSKDKKAALKSLAEEYNIPQSWIDTSEAKRKEDKAYEYSKDIHIQEIYEYKPTARFVMFDACDNGSFQEDDCIANAYIFSDGNTIATQGNTIGSIQDKHPNAYIGLLASGLRIGQWSRYAQNFLGSHIIGDPTYRFENQFANESLFTGESRFAGNSPLASVGEEASAESVTSGSASPDLVSSGSASPRFDINYAIVNFSTDNDFWLSILEGEGAAETIDPQIVGSDLQAIAVRMLADNSYPKIEQLAVDLYKSSPYGSVRMECLKALYNSRGLESSRYDADSKLIEILTYALNDSYELVRRFAVEYAGTCGDPQLLPHLVNSAINDRMSARVEYRAVENLRLYPRQEVVAELDKQLAINNHLLNPDSIKESILSKRKWTDESFAKMFDVVARLKQAAASGTAGDAGDGVSAVGVSEAGCTAAVKGLTAVAGVSAEEMERCLKTLTQLRNSNCHFLVPQVIEIVEDALLPLELRVTAVEVLGWFDASYRNPEIVAACKKVLAMDDVAAPLRLKQETEKTLQRLK